MAQRAARRSTTVKAKAATQPGVVAGPRVYNLFPLLAGPIREWPAHVARAAEMGFNWVFVNPFFEPGYSGSLYAIRDPYRLHPLVRGDAEGDAATLVKEFTAAARKQGVAVMMDLVINHTARDAGLLHNQPDWFAREPDGEVRAPRAVDPTDPRRFTVWSDLAELDYRRDDARAGQVGYWLELVRHYLDCGVRGFRCDAAYMVPVEVWREIIGQARIKQPDCLFAGETLGCTPQQVLALKDAGFDYLFNSSKWWDFKSPWLLEQYDLYRQVAPTIAFPESHDTPRLAAELAEHEDALQAYRLRYLFAACFSSGVLMPMGYEYGCRKPLHVVDSRPGDWAFEAERPAFDLSDYVAAVNAMKAACPALNVEGPQRRITSPHAGVVGLLRLDAGTALSARSAAIVVVNPDPARAHGLDAGQLLGAVGGRFGEFSDVTPDVEPMALLPGTPLTLAPLEMRVFAAEVPAQEAKPPRGVARKLEELAVNRVAIEAVRPELDGGRFAVKRALGEVLSVSADVFCDGHDVIKAAIAYRVPGEQRWREAPLTFFDNDRWVGSVPLTRIGRWLYSIVAWRDLFAAWRVEVGKKLAADVNVALETIEGRDLVAKAAEQASGRDQGVMRDVLERFDRAAESDRLALLLDEELATVMARSGPRTNLSRYDHDLELVVDRATSRFAAWYEIFPRSASHDVHRHGTFDDVIKLMPYVQGMGFDVLYFPPIHPIGKTNRKGRNNTLTPGPDDPGSPYAIGSEVGGHTAIHPELGTLDDFKRMVAAGHEHGLEIALDFAIQCSPDHPWIKEHPEWFDWRPDGTIKFAENPPKKYEDIVNVHFYRDALPAIWHELRDVVLFWVDAGVKVFRVDNPHTKPLPFWEWMIREVQDRHPDTVFLAEAFTRPKMMGRLAKVGFTQSYSYFTWRNTKHELESYLTELTQGPAAEYMLPNFFANTPDINPVYLQTSGPAGYVVRGTLAATLSPVYGLYNGFELCEGRPVPGKEEYLDSEKYEIKAWDYDRPGNIRDFITRLNHIRRENPALRGYTNLRFYNAWHEQIMVYGKMTPDRDNAVLVAVNLDPHHAHGCHFEVPLWEFGLPDDAGIEVEDLLSGHRFAWHGKVQHVWLDPALSPVAIWQLVPPGRG